MSVRDRFVRKTNIGATPTFCCTSKDNILTLTFLIATSDRTADKSFAKTVRRAYCLNYLPHATVVKLSTTVADKKKTIPQRILNSMAGDPRALTDRRSFPESLKMCDDSAIRIGNGN